MWARSDESLPKRKGAGLARRPASKAFLLFGPKGLRSGTANDAISVVLEKPTLRRAFGFSRRKRDYLDKGS